MRVSELVEELADLDGSLEVVLRFSYHDGDKWSEVFPCLMGVEQLHVDKHGLPCLDEDADHNRMQVVVLRD